MIIKRCWACLFLLFSFILGSHEGYIALWKDGDPKPVRVFPYSVRSLPQADQEALEKGIRIDSESELIRLVEDYLS